MWAGLHGLPGCHVHGLPQLGWLACLAAHRFSPCSLSPPPGTLEPVPEEGLQKAQRLLFSRHPDMHTWPEGHSFRIHELHLRAARILTFYGGPTDLTPEQYFGAELDPDETQQLAAA